MFFKRFGIPVFHSTEKLVEHATSDDMTYNDEYHESGTKIAYDGALIDLADAQTRYKRDKARQHNYARAEEELDEEQMTWSDVTRQLNAPMHDPRAGNVGASKPKHL